MNSPSDEWDELQRRVLGFGDTSAHKSYYPALRRRLQELERAQAALEASEHRLQLAVEGAQLGMWDWDLRSGVVVVNRQWREMLGVEDHEDWTIGQVLALLHPEDRESVQAPLLEEARGSEPVTLELRLRHRDGRWVSVMLRGGIIERGADGRPLRAAGTQLDISKLRAAELAQQRLTAQVQQVQKLESLGVLAGGIAHDFNNLLVAILGYAELCRDDAPPGSELAENAAEICTAATRAAELTNQMLAYSGRGHFVVEPLDLSEVVAEMGRLLSVSIPKKVSLRYDLAARLPAVSADVAQVRQVVMNLVTNAADAIGDQPGEVRVRTGTMEADAKMLRSAYLDTDLEAGTYVCLEVSDDGCGMDAATQERIFDPFFTTKATGRGLGMAAVLGIVRGHGASIHVESEVGRGTTFHLLFPAASVKAQVEGCGPPTPDLPKRQARILVVDDEPAVRHLLKRALERFGWVAEEAEDGPTALAIYEARPGSFDLVILDLTMPLMDGREVFRRLVAINPRVKVLLSSGFSAEETEGHFHERERSGAPDRLAGRVATGAEGPLVERQGRLAGFIQKPFTFDALRAAVYEALTQ
ncbi:MAG: response regulator [Myxococcales bacterium]|nr:response regulator [Myxococcales bacterium]